MHLDGTFQPAIVRVVQVGIASTNVGYDNCVLAFKSTEQFVGRVDGIG